MTLFTPSPELVAVAWVRGLRLPLTSDVSTTLPAINRWEQPCYVQVTAIGGQADPYDPRRNPLIRVDVWGAPKKYAETNSVAELVQDAAMFGTGQGIDLSVRQGHRPVHLAEVSVWQPPSALREPADPETITRLRQSTGTGARSGEATLQRIPNQQKLARTTMQLALVYQIVRS